MEVGTEILKRQLRVAFEMPDIKQARIYLDSLAVSITRPTDVVTTKIDDGSWFIPRDTSSGLWILYLHGGGYSFYPRAFYDGFAAFLALSSHARLFALDYRLTPEYKYPAQLEDALHAYHWLLASGAEPKRLVVIGDSAGGNLALALLLSLRDSRLPFPALTICLSPATDFRASVVGPLINSELDWISEDMALRWADWFCSSVQRDEGLVSPVTANLAGLPPIYIQAGGAEMLLPAIEEFARQAKQQGCDVILETWPEMNHDFQMFGSEVPQSTAALERICAVIVSRLAPGNQYPAGDEAAGCRSRR
jgi:acetyl esterase/lipase